MLPTVSAAVAVTRPAGVSQRMTVSGAVAG